MSMAEFLVYHVHLSVQTLHVCWLSGEIVQLVVLKSVFVNIGSEPFAELSETTWM
jgi:hypothetical protein